jgi:hypothetical protein
MLCGESFGGGAFDSASRLGKLGQPRGTSTGVETDGRSAARHVSPLPQGRGRVTRRKGWRSRPPSLRGLKSLGFSCPHVEVQLQKSLGDVWPRISSANALQKERQGRVNGGLARSEGRRVKPSASGSSEGNGSRVGPSPIENGRGPAQTQGDERSSSSGRHIAKSGAAVAGPGL